MMINLNDYDVAIIKLALIEAKINQQRRIGAYPEDQTVFDKVIAKINQSMTDDYINNFIRRTRNNGMG